MRPEALSAQHLSDAAPRPMIFCFPDASAVSGSMYLAGSHRTWRALGYQTRDLMPSIGWRWLAGRAGRIVVLNWFEDYMLLNRRPMAMRVLRALALLLLMRAGAGRMVWVRHNFHPHGLKGQRWAHAVLIRCLGLLADRVVTHRPVPGMGSLVVPHTLPDVEPASLAGDRDIEFLWVGQVRRYKGLTKLLAVWPRERRLVMLGRSQDDALSAEIDALIHQRRLDVVWENRFVEPDQLDAALRRTRFVVIGHVDDSMIVSGVVYHAIGFGANVLIRDGELARHLAAAHRFVHRYDDASLPQRLHQIVPLPAVEVFAEATRAYGLESCKAGWLAALA